MMGQLSVWWESDYKSSFETLVAAEAASYCTTNAPTCGISAGFLFTTDQVGFSGSLEEESKDLKITFYIDFPVIRTVIANSSTQYVVNSAAAETIVRNIRVTIADTVGHEITYIGETFYGIDPDKKMNSIIIPIAFVVLIIVIIIAVALHMWNKRKEEVLKKQKKREEKKKKSTRIMPTCTMETEQKRSNTYGHWQVDQSSLTKTQNNAISLNEMSPGELVYEEKVVPRNNALPPLPNPAEEKTADEEEAERQKKEKKRRKKEKRRRQREAEEGGETNDGMEESEIEKSRSEGHGKVVPVENA
nr:hypothetical protein BaRGS_010517 [Batillaria attramentaria]